MTSTSSPPNWASLVERARLGDRAACRALYERADGPVFRQCLLSARGDRARAEDLAQESWAHIFTKLGQLRAPQAFVGWAVITASSMCASRQRLHHRQAVLLEQFAAEASLETAVDDEADRQRREALVRELVEQLDDPKQQALVRAVYVDGLTTRATAERLAVPHGTVTVTLQRLRVSLRRRLLLALAEEGLT